MVTIIYGLMLLQSGSAKGSVTAFPMAASPISMYMRYLGVFIAAMLWMSCGKKGSGKSEVESSGPKIPADALVFDKDSGLTHQTGETTPFTGKAVWYYSSGQIQQESSYSDGKEHGPEVWWHESGARAGQSEYKEGVLDGPTVQWYPDGKQMELQTLFQNGKQQGREIWWHSNGKEKSITLFVNGERQGKAKGRFKDGTLGWEADWKDDEPHGKYSEFYESGKPQSEKNFVMGKEEGMETSWYENGQKSSEVSWKKGRMMGTLIEWHENGRKMSETPYVDGLRQGAASGWYESGVKAFESTYIEDEEVGIVEWLETGELVRPTSVSVGRSSIWRAGQLEQIYPNKPKGNLYAAFGEPDRVMDGAWVYEGIKLDGGNQTLLRNVRFTFQSGKVKSVKVEVPDNRTESP